MMQDSCLVATFAMARMAQDRGESCRSFASRLRGVARTCDFMETCPHCNHQVDCSESRVSDQLCIGVADQDIQQDLLEEITKRLTVEQVLHFVEKKTLGKKAANNPTMDHQAGATTGEQAAKTTRRRPADPIAIPTKSCSCPTRSQPPARPTSLPFPATEANRQRMEEYLLNLYSSSSFNTCEHQTLPMMTSPPLALSIDPNATPKPCHNPIPVPVHWQEEVKRGLDRDVALGVLKKVPLGTPVTWCHRMVICTKKNGSLRRTIDFQPLNAHATRETHHCPSPFHQARAVPRNTRKTILNAWNGYHSVPLREEDRHFTTFITPWGRYRYMTAPQGHIASGLGRLQIQRSRRCSVQT